MVVPPPPPHSGCCFEQGHLFRHRMICFARNAAFVTAAWMAELNVAKACEKAPHFIRGVLGDPGMPCVDALMKIGHCMAASVTGA